MMLIPLDAIAPHLEALKNDYEILHDKNMLALLEFTVKDVYLTL